MKDRKELKSTLLSELTNDELIELVKIYIEEKSIIRQENITLYEKIKYANKSVSLAIDALNKLTPNDAHRRLKQYALNELGNTLLIINQTGAV